VNVSSDQMTELARRVVFHETAGHETATDLAIGIERMFQRLRELVANLVGDAGFGAVLARASSLNKRACPWLETSAIVVGPIVVFSGLAAVVEREGAARVTGCTTHVLSDILGLLSRFVGEDLTLQLVNEVWKDLPKETAPGSPEES